jgi:hypothetical protein
MLETVIVLLTSVAALVGATMATETKPNESRTTPFKRPTFAGWAIMALIVLLTGFQLVLKRRAHENSQLDRVIDSMRSQRLLDEALAHAKQLSDEKALMQAAYDSQLKTLTNTSSLLGNAEAMQSKMNQEFASASSKFQALLNQSASLARPILPMVIRIRFTLPMSSPVLAGWRRRTEHLRDSLMAEPLRQRRGQLTVAAQNAADSSGRVVPGPASYAVIDSTSDLYIRRDSDGPAVSLLNPTFDLRVFASPPSIYRINPDPIMVLEAHELTQVGFGNAFARPPMEVMFRDSTVTLNLFYRINPLATRGSIVGISELAGKYLLVSSRLPMVDFRIEQIVLYTGPTLTQATLIFFRPEDDVSPRPEGKALWAEYLRRIDSSEVR